MRYSGFALANSVLQPTLDPETALDRIDRLTSKAFEKLSLKD
ncbi:MAG: hypothetical protein VX438_16690 [Planctomycetota bacterium]|nr:hypothetical protein [Planctomycetota bacterium]